MAIDISLDGLIYLFLALATFAGGIFAWVIKRVSEGAVRHTRTEDRLDRIEDDQNRSDQRHGEDINEIKEWLNKEAKIATEEHRLIRTELKDLRADMDKKLNYLTQQMLTGSGAGAKSQSENH